MTGVQFTMFLMELELTIQVVHWQTIEWEHLVTNELYAKVHELKDRFVESYQGQYGILTGYKPIAVNDGVDIRKYLREAQVTLDTYQRELPGYLQQIVLDIQEAVSVARYKLG